MKKSAFYLSALCATVIAASACSPIVASRGNMLADYQIASVLNGQDSKADVMQKLGSPTTQSTFNENVWYYMGQTTEKRGIFDPKVTAERIVMVEFDEMGVVKSIGPLDNNRVNVPISDRKTETAGTELSPIQDLLGNLGRFNNTAKQDDGLMQ